MAGERKKLHRKLGREAFAAVALTLFSLPALVFSAFLTVLKFRTSHRCDGFMQNVCSSGCDIALTDSWAVVLGLPISAYGTAFYLIVLMLGLTVGVWPLTFALPARLLILVLGIAGLGVSLLLGAYAWFGLGAWCIYCTLLYIANVGIFLSARLLNPEGVWRGLRNGLQRLDFLSGALSWAVLSAFVACVILQARIYSHAAAHAIRDRIQHTTLSCEEARLRELPQTELRLKSDQEPEVIVALFFDLACPHCRKEVDFWRDLQKEHRGFLQLEFFHLSADSACGGPLDNSTLRKNHSCSGALALECLNSIAGGDALTNMERLFALQDRGTPHFSEENLKALAEEHGVEGLIDCINSPDPLKSVHKHIDFGVSMKLNAPPSALIIPIRNGKPLGTALRLRGGAKSRAYIEAKIMEYRKRSRGDE